MDTAYFILVIPIVYTYIVWERSKFRNNLDAGMFVNVNLKDGTDYVDHKVVKGKFLYYLDKEKTKIAAEVNGIRKEFKIEDVYIPLPRDY